MNDELERRLRDSLQARAGDVEPTPELYARVEAHVNRNKRWTLVLSGVGVAAAIAVAAAVLPSLLDRGTVEPPIVGPGTPLPTDAPTDPTPSPTDGPGDAVFSEHAVLAGDDRIWLADVRTGQEIAELVDFGGPENESEIVAVEVRPGSTLEDLTVVYVLQGEGAFTFGWIAYDGTDATYAPFPDTHQPSADLVGDALPIPAFDPTGAHLAWVEPLRGEDNQAPTLRTIGWSNGPGTGDIATDNAGFTLDEIPIEHAPSDFVVDDWVWTQQAEGTRRGHLLVTGALQAWRVPIEEQSDGALARGSDPIELITVPERAVIDLAATVGELTYTLVVGGSTSQDAEDLNLTLLISGPDGEDEGMVPDVSTADPSGIWMTVYGEGYAIGLGGFTEVFVPGGRYRFDASYADFVR
ncbi:MAG TPA: hypothetical protein VGA69_12530 [Nitriliruptorales bacterium]